jgi:hypothetical protein
MCHGWVTSSSEHVPGCLHCPVIPGHNWPEAVLRCWEHNAELLNQVLNRAAAAGCDVDDTFKADTFECPWEPALWEQINLPCMGDNCLLINANESDLCYVLVDKIVQRTMYVDLHLIFDAFVEWQVTSDRKWMSQISGTMTTCYQPDIFFYSSFPNPRAKCASFLRSLPFRDLSISSRQLWDSQADAYLKHPDVGSQELELVPRIRDMNVLKNFPDVEEWAECWSATCCATWSGGMSGEWGSWDL